MLGSILERAVSEMHVRSDEFNRDLGHMKL